MDLALTSWGITFLHRAKVLKARDRTSWMNGSRAVDDVAWRTLSMGRIFLKSQLTPSLQKLSMTLLRKCLWINNTNYRLCSTWAKAGIGVKVVGSNLTKIKTFVTDQHYWLPDNIRVTLFWTKRAEETCIDGKNTDNSSLSVRTSPVFPIYLSPIALTKQLTWKDTWSRRGRGRELCNFRKQRHKQLDKDPLKGSRK